MNFEKAISKYVKNIYECLQDEESKEIFINMLNYYLNRDAHCMVNRKHSYDNLKNVNPACSLNYFINNYIHINEKEKQVIILYPADDYTISTIEHLKLMNINVKFLCDFDEMKQKSVFEGLPVLSPDNVLKEQN